MTKLIKVANHSESALVAGAIVGVLHENQQAEVQAIGANAVNQAVKAVAIARTYLGEEEFDLWMTPSFTKVQIDNKEHTALRFHIWLCQRGSMPNNSHPQQEENSCLSTSSNARYPTSTNCRPIKSAALRPNPAPP